MTAGFSPNAPNRALFSRVAEGRDVLLPKKKNHFDAIWNIIKNFCTVTILKWF